VAALGSGRSSHRTHASCIFLLRLPPRALVLQVMGDVLAFDVSRHLAAEGATSSPLVPIGRPILGHQVLLLNGSQEAVQDDQVRIQIGAAPRGGFVRMYASTDSSGVDVCIRTLNAYIDMPWSAVIVVSCWPLHSVNFHVMNLLSEI
jgi:hypothetical protein